MLQNQKKDALVEDFGVAGHEVVIQMVFVCVCVYVCSVCVCVYVCVVCVCLDTNCL